MGALTSRRTSLVVFVVLMAVSFALYPYLGAMDDGEGCPYAVQSSHTTSVGSAEACLSAVLAASPVAVLALATLRGRRVIAEGTRPADIFLSFDPPPPRFSL